MKVMICSVLHSYTGGQPVVEAAGTSVAALLDDLERRYPGMRFRIVDEQGGLRPICASSSTAAGPCGWTRRSASRTKCTSCRHWPALSRPR